ncbi:MAG: CRISPR-associated endonuclease Cas6 [Candidatus Scalinduaceae bacterium]
MKILSCVVRLYFDNSTDDLDIQSKDLRGAIAYLYPNEILLHQHLEDGTLKYNYPIVQYKYVNKKCLIVGIEKGAKVINNLNLIGEIIILSHQKYKILKKDIMFQESSYSTTKKMVSYSLLTPWLALNEKNYEKYQKLGSWQKRKELLCKILIGNIISMSKSLGYTVPEAIMANISKLEEVRTSLKGTPMLGFLGTFSVNFEIPDYWGIGKSVSRGFGTIKRVDGFNR